MPLTSLRDLTAVVTGGASGIGRAMALLFAREGAHVVVADLDEAGMAETVAGVEQAGRRGLGVRTDVSRLTDLHALAERAVAAFGAVHVLCNNAGVALWGGLESATHKDWEWAINRIARLVKDTRDKDFITRNEKGELVNRVESIGHYGTSNIGNEECWTLSIACRALGLVNIDHQARV